MLKSLPIQFAAFAAVVTVAAIATYLPVSYAQPSTYAAAFGVMIGIGAVMLLTWRNALPTETVGQLLQRTETNDAKHPVFQGRRP